MFLLSWTAATLTSLVGGAVLGWTSPVLDELNLMGPRGSWVASLAPLGALVGAALAGWLATCAGRKPLILALVVPNVAGWGVLVAAGNDSVSTVRAKSTPQQRQSDGRGAR